MENIKSLALPTILGAVTIISSLAGLNLAYRGSGRLEGVDPKKVAAKVIFTPDPKNPAPKCCTAGGSRKKDSASIYLPIQKEGSEITLAQSIENQAKTPRYIPPSRRGAPARTQGGGSRNERPPVIALSFPQPNLQDLMAQAETEYRGSGRLETGGRTA